MNFDHSTWISFKDATKDLYKGFKRHDRKVRVKKGDYDTDVLTRRKEWPAGGMHQLQQCVRAHAPPLIEKVSIFSNSSRIPCLSSVLLGQSIRC